MEKEPWQASKSRPNKFGQKKTKIWLGRRIRPEKKKIKLHFILSQISLEYEWLNLIHTLFFMKLYIKTPRYKDNKYVPHLVEHCILQTNNIQDFFDVQLPIYASTNTWYTKFEFDKEYLKLFQKTLGKDISKENYELQEKIIKKELKWASFWQKFYIDTLRKISLNKNLVSNSIQYWITLKDINDYKNKYYKPENMVLVNDNNEIIDFWWAEKWMNSDPEISLKWNIEYKKTKFKWDYSDNIFVKYKTPYDIIILDFFCDLICDYTYYLDTNKWKYRYDYSDISLTDKYIILSFEEWYLPKKLNKEFFEKYKNYFKKWIENWKNREYIPIIALFTNQYISAKQHINFIEQLEYNLINNLLSNCISKN